MATQGGKVVIVGASMAGQSAAVELRKQGYDGEILMVSQEEHLPYDRPPLSKKIITREWDFEKIKLKDADFYSENNIQLKLGHQIGQVDPVAKTITTVSMEVIGYDVLILATGGRPRRLDVPGRDLDGIHQVLEYSDSLRVAEELGAGAQRVVVVGGGFIGAEAAAALAEHGKDVSLIEVSPSPMSYALGSEVGDVFNRIFKEEGVTLDTKTTIASYHGADGRVTHAKSFDGKVFEADLVIECVGILPNVELAEAAGCRVDNGVVVDGFMRTNVEDVYAIGDIARFPSHYADGPRNGEATGLVRIEHWAVAIGHGAAAARAICGSDDPYDELPWFWSDQFGVTYNYAGHATTWDQTVWRGDVGERKFSVFYLREGRLAGALCAGRPKDFRAAKKLLSDGSPIDLEVLADPDSDLLKYAKSVSS